MSRINDFLQSLKSSVIIKNYINEHKDEFIIIDGENLIKLQNCLLHILKDFDMFCQKHKLKYCITGGTLLGKVRHNGFIPWDDDLDINMPREDYDKLKQIYEQSDDDFCKKYLFRGPGYSKGATVRIGKIYKDDSIMETIIRKDNSIDKVFIDIFPIDYVPDNCILKYIRGILSIIIIMIISCVERKENGRNNYDFNFGFFYKITSFIRLFFGTIFSLYPLNRWYKLLDDVTRNTKNNIKSKCVTAATGTLLYFDEMLSAEVYFPLKRTEFCGVDTWIPNRPEEYLSNRYGNWKKIPEEKDREVHYVKRLDVGRID